MVSLAAIDLSKPDSQIIEEMMHQFTTVGFAYVKNFSSEWDEQIHFEMIKAFHDMPDEVKHGLKMRHHNQANSNRYRGLAPFMDNDPSHKELFDMGWPNSTLSQEAKKYPLVEDTPFSTDDKYKHLQEGYERHYMLFHKLSLKLISFLAVGLGKPADFFDAWFEKDVLSTFRSIYYLPRAA